MSTVVRPRVSRGLTGTLQGFFWAVGGLAGLAVVFALVGAASLEEYAGARPGSRAESAAWDDMIAADAAINGVVGLATWGAVVLFILMIIWTHQAHQATQFLYRGPRKWTSGWAVAGWFIPVGNAIIPKLVLNEIERIAIAPRVAGRPSDDWAQRPTLAGGWIWWIAFVVGTAVGGIGFGLFDDRMGSVSSWRAGYWMVAGGFACIATSAVFGALFVRRIGRELS